MVSKPTQWDNELAANTTPDTGEDQLARLATGNPNLITRPGLLQSLQQNNATPAQAATVNSFLGGLAAQQRVNLAMATPGTKITLSQDEMGLLDNMGVNYASVQYTHQDAINAAAAQSPTGQTTTDAEGNIVPVTPTTAPAAKKSSGWSFGRVVHDTLHNPVTNALGEGWNVVDAAAGATGAQLAQLPGNLAGSAEAASGGNRAANLPQSNTNAEQMKAQGYDPSNPISVAAYAAKGKQHSDTSDLSDSWDSTTPNALGWTGDQAVIEAEKYSDNPSQYVKQMLADPTIPAAMKTARIQSQQFQNLVEQVASRKSSVGNDFANALHIDPVKDATKFAIVSGVTDAAASFLLDPTMLAGGALGAVKTASIGLDNLGDSERILHIMGGSMPAQRAVQRGFQSAMDDAATVRRGLDAGDAAGEQSAAAAMAHARATTPGLVELFPDMAGHQYDFVKGEAFEGAPITNLTDMAEYLASKNALMRLTSGKAALESGLMPGAVSRFGYRALKGKTAAVIAGRSTKFNQKLDTSINLAKDSGKWQATADDAVDLATGESRVAGAAATTVTDAAGAAVPVAGVPASAARASVTAAERGTALFNLRRTGNVTGDGAVPGWISPTATAARLRLSAQRLSSLLPRNDVIVHGSADGTEKVARFGRMFLNPGDSALYAARYATGGEGVQKAVIDGIRQQTAHAAGLGTTEGGRDLMATLSDRLGGNHYGHIGNEQIVDPVTGVSKDAALHLSQLADTAYLPSFAELNRASTNIGIWQNTVGRVFNSKLVDTLGDTARMAMLFKPNIAIRNMIEGQGHILVRGKYMQFLQAKALLRDADNTASDAAEQTLRDSGETDSKVIEAARHGVTVMTPRKQIVQKAINAVGLDRVGQAYRYLLGRTITTGERKIVMDFAAKNPDEWRATVLGYGDQIVGSSVDPMGVGDVDKIFRGGYGAKRYTRVGYGKADTNGIVGADRYNHALATRVGQYPDVDRAVINAIRNPEAGINGVVKALSAHPNVLNRMTRTGVYTDDLGVSRIARSADEKRIALEQMAQLQVADMKYLYADKDGNEITSITDHVLNHGQAPSAKWINDNLPEEGRPAAVLAPQYRAVPIGMTQGGFIRNLLDSAGSGYKAMVEDPIKRTTTEPAFMMHYVEHMKLLTQPMKDMVDKGGLTEDAAWRAGHDLAVKRAYNETEAMIDDPGLKTQADIVGRNFFMFSRAIQAFARRWGGLVIQDPVKLRKVFLAVEGMHHAGLVNTDPNGGVNFTYPGSDLLMGAMQHLESLIPGMGPAVQYPLSGGLTGQLNMIAPGINNPARFSMSPMLNTPFHLLENLTPQYRTKMDSIDRLLNGQDSQGKAWYSEFEPGMISKLTAAGKGDQRDSAYASAMVGAIANLEAADPDGSKGLFPPASATASQRQVFFDRLGTQVQNQLYLRSVFGEFAPAPPGLPGEQTAASGKVDPLYKAEGINNLSDEYKQMLNDAGGDRSVATQQFLANHPERLIYTIPTSQSGTNKAYIPPTSTADEWIEKNTGFINKFGSVSSYFVPQDNGDFDLHAYRAEIETGMRQKLTPQEFYDKYRVTSAEQEYYAAMDQRDAASNARLLVGDKKGSQNILAGFSAWAKSFTAVNPLFAQKQASYVTSVVTAKDAVTDLTKVVNDPNAPSNVKKIAPGLKDMIDSYNAHTAWGAQHKGATTKDKIIAAAEVAGYKAHMFAIASSDPNLTNIYNGVFRAIDSGLQQVDAAALQGVNSVTDTTSNGQTDNTSTNTGTTDTSGAADTTDTNQTAGG